MFFTYILEHFFYTVYACHSVGQGPCKKGDGEGGGAITNINYLNWMKYSETV